jgi:hypothetical protein
MRLYHDIDYVGRARTGRANGRYEKIGKFIESGEPVEMPEACLNRIKSGDGHDERYLWVVLFGIWY